MRCTPTGASSPGVPAASSSQRPSLACPLAGCPLAAPYQATTLFHRSGLQHARACLLCRLLTSAGRSGRMPPPSVLSGHPADLPRSAVRPSVQRRPIYEAQPACGWRTSLSRARSPRRYHTSSRVRVPRPAPSFHATFRRPLARTPLRFPGPSAPRTPGQETFTPKHDRMHGTHAGGEPPPEAGARHERTL